MFRQLIYPSYARLTRPNRNASRRTSERGGMLQTGAVISFAVGIDTDLTLAYQLFSFLLCMIVLSRLAIRFQKPNVKLHRRLPRFATAGEPFSYQILITNLGDHVEQDLRIADNPTVITPGFDEFLVEREPLEETRNAYDRWIGFHRFIWLQRRKTGISVKQSSVPDIHRRSTVDTRIEAQPLRRGLVHFHSTSLLNPDPLGLNYHITNFENPDSLIILPRRYQVNDRHLLPVGRHFQPGGVNPTWSIGESEEFVSLRDYREGDPLRKIHWASSAKRSKPVVKEYQDEFFVRHTLVLETMSTDATLLEEAVSVAASIILKFRDTDGIIDLMYLADRPRHLSTGRGSAETNHQLVTLATLTASTRPFSELANLAKHQAKLMSGCYLIFTGWDEEHQKLLSSLQNAGIPTMAFVVAPVTSALWDLPSGVLRLPVGHVGEELAK